MIACVVIPFFAASLRHSTPAISNTPLIVIEYRGQRGKVIACSASAQRMGVERGISFSRARALCPQAQFITADTALYNEMRDRLCSLFWEFTNRVELDLTVYPHTAVGYLDLGNLKSANLNYLGNLISSNLREQMGLHASIGISRRKSVAYIAAISTRIDTITLVPVGEEAAYIAPHSVELLPLDKHQAHRLRILGIDTLGTLASLSRASVMAQFGRAGAVLHPLALGLDGTPVKPQRMPELETVHQHFEALNDRPRLEVRIYNLAEQLAERLDQRRSALHQLTVTFHVERGKPIFQSTHLFEPVTSSRAIGDSVLQMLNRVKLAQALTGIELCASHLVPAMPTQLELFSERPMRHQLLDLASALAAQHGTLSFLQVRPVAPTSLLPERRFHLRHIDAS